MAGFLFSYSGYFIAGILLFQRTCQVIGKTEFATLITLNTALLFYQNGGVLTALAVGSLLVIFFVKKVHPVFRWFGLISYSLYLVHVPLGGRIINFAESSNLAIPMRDGIIFAAFGACILFAFLYFKLFEQKFKVLSAAIKYNEPGPAPVPLRNGGAAAKQP